MFVSRRFIRFACLVALMVSALSFAVVSAQEPTTLNIYVNADTNISDWLSNIVTPGFEAANPEYKLNVVIARNADYTALIDRMVAAKEAGADPLVDEGDAFLKQVATGTIKTTKPSAT
jgi:hypothetical protein